MITQSIKGWHGAKLNQPDWSDHSHSVALSAKLEKEGLHIHFIFNAYWEPIDFELPPVGNSDEWRWCRWIDTSLDSPQDIVEWQTAPAVPGGTYRAGPRSVTVLWAHQ